jgi:hypothetical protein
MMDVIAKLMCGLRCDRDVDDASFSSRSLLLPTLQQY